MPVEKKIAHLEIIRKDMRDEIKRRVEQRDKYSIQLTIALGAIVSVSVGVNKALIAAVGAPLVSIYFTVLILYSYRIHQIQTEFLLKKIEPQLARLCETPYESEWEAYYQSKAVPGIRRWFFLFMLWLVCIGSSAYLLCMLNNVQDEFMMLRIVAVVIYILTATSITVSFARIREEIKERIRVLAAIVLRVAITVALWGS